MSFRAKVLASTVVEGELARMRGFLGRTSIGEEERLLFKNTRFVHTFGMRTPIDVVFLDKNYRIVRIAANVGAWRIIGCRQAWHVLEMAPGSAIRKGLAVGDVLALEGENGPAP